MLKLPKTALKLPVLCILGSMGEFNMEYPHLNFYITHDDLIEHFTLSQDERYLLTQWRKDVNKIGFAVLLKSFQYLGYPPKQKKDIPDIIVSFICGQLEIQNNLFGSYRWKNSIWKLHLGAIRKFTGFRNMKKKDHIQLYEWLLEKAENHPTRSTMYIAAVQRCKKLRFELPKEKPLQRSVHSLWQEYYNSVCQKISERLNPEMKTKIDDILEVDPDDKVRYGWMTGTPRKTGIKTLLLEIDRLQFVREFNINPDTHLKEVPPEILKLLYERGLPEGTYQLKRHHHSMRYAMITVMLHFRSVELADSITKIFLKLINRIDKKADKSLEKELIKTIRKVYKKKEILYKMAKASTENPDDTIENVLFPVVREETLHQIVKEFENQDLDYENTKAKEKKNKYTRSYRRILKPVFDAMVFRTANPVCEPLLKGLALIRKYIDTKHSYYPEAENVPIELLKNIPEKLWADRKDGVTRVVKHYFELVVLQKLDKALNNKEIWVEGSFRYRNPDKNLPQDWSEKYIYYCDKHKIPDRSDDFIEPIQEEVETWLTKANNFFSERLLLSLLGRGTGIGLKGIHAAAKPNFSYRELLYFNKRFVHIDSVRETIAALVNRILEVRSPGIWKDTKTCTSDGKYLGAWEQNFAAQWNPHYQETGIMSYFLVDENSTGVHSQIRQGTEVSAMITSLIEHDTMMSIESNCVDSHGQSELGFAFCRLMSVELLPWLKRMKYERLYLPGTDRKNSFPNLTGVLARPIRWDHAHEHYSDMVRHVVAAKERTAPVDSLLRRFNRNNPASQTYKGFLEIGKALKTIHNCKFLTDASYRHRIFKGRNIVENWNSAVDVICYGGKSEIQTNNPDVQELTVLCLHLLQNALVLVNTAMVERVLFEDNYIENIDSDDRSAITPLFTSNMNPYGDITLDVTKPSFLEV